MLCICPVLRRELAQHGAGSNELSGAVDARIRDRVRHDHVFTSLATRRPGRNAGTRRAAERASGRSCLTERDTNHVLQPLLLAWFAICK